MSRSVLRGLKRGGIDGGGFGFSIARHRRHVGHPGHQLGWVSGWHNWLYGRRVARGHCVMSACKVSYLTV